MTKTITEKAVDKLGRLEDSVSYYGRLIEALGNPAEWEYTGKMIDTGVGAASAVNAPQCACGHPIRFVFIIKHPMKGETQLGSTCIGHFEHVNPTTFKALTEAAEKMGERVKDELRKIKEIKQQEEIAKLEKEYKEKIEELKALAEKIKEEADLKNYRPLPYPLWYILHGWNGKNIICLFGSPQYKRKSAYIRFYKNTIDKIQQLIDNPEKFPGE